MEGLAEFDNPVSALDIYHQLEVLEVARRMTRERGLTTLIVLHNLNATARFCDDVALLQSGHLLASGTPAQVLTVAHIAQAFGVETEALRCSDGTGALLPMRAMMSPVANQHAIYSVAASATPISATA